MAYWKLLFCTKLHGLFCFQFMLECLNPKNSRTAHFRTAVFLQINFQITVMETFQLGLEINEDFSPPQKLNGGSDPARQHLSSQLCPWQQHFACVCVQGEQEELSALLAHGQAGAVSFLISLAGNPGILRGMKSALATKPLAQKLSLSHCIL